MKMNKFPIAENQRGAAPAASRFPPAVLYDSKGEEWRIERSSQGHPPASYINTWIVEQNNSVVDDFVSFP